MRFATSSLFEIFCPVVKFVSNFPATPFQSLQVQSLFLKKRKKERKRKRKGGTSAGCDRAPMVEFKHQPMESRIIKAKIFSILHLILLACKPNVSTSTEPPSPTPWGLLLLERVEVLWQPAKVSQIGHYKKKKKT